MYSIQLKIDGKLYYSFKMDRFAFSESRYINSHIDYAEYQRSRRRFHKTWIDSGNKLSIYDFVHENGIIDVTDGNIHHVRFELTDTHGNTSVLEFNIESVAGSVQADTGLLASALKSGREFVNKRLQYLDQFRLLVYNIRFPSLLCVMECFLPNFFGFIFVIDYFISNG